MSQRQFQYQTYISGNTARNLEPERQYWDGRERLRQEEIRRERQRQEEEQQWEEQEARRRQRRERALARNLDAVSLLILIAAIGITMWTLVGYLTVNSDITNMSKKAASLEKQIISMQKDNETALARANASVDLEEVYRIATEELGMVHASSNRVIQYESTKSDYVKQYSDVPDTKESNLIDSVIGEVKNWYGQK